MATISPLVSRAELWRALDRSASTFWGRRNFNRALGYTDFLTPEHYWDRYRRGGIAKRIVEAFPKSTWRAGGELVEDEDPDVTTTFEHAWDDLNKRLKIWNIFQRADILAGLGYYAVILLGAPGNVSDPLERCKPNDLKYLTPFGQRSVRIDSFVEDTLDERYGQPEYYTLIFRRALLGGSGSAETDKAINRVHYTRVMHIAENALEDPLYGQPRLEAVWNYLDDLIKCVGGGSEAFWKRIDGGKQIKLDPTMPNPTNEQKAELHEQIEEYTHELRRILTTRGVDIQDLGSSVANFNSQVASLFDLISATTGIPQRILMGSERGELASTQDQSNYDDRVEDRRNDFAEPMVVRPFVDRMIELGVLPEAEYNVRWPEIKNMTDTERMGMAKDAALLNHTQGETVITSNEIRDRILGYPALTDEQIKEEAAKVKTAPSATPGAFGAGGITTPPATPPDNSDNSDTSGDGDSGTDRNLNAVVTALEAALMQDDFLAAEHLVMRALGD